MLNERNTLLEDDGIEEEIPVEEESSVAQAVWGDIQGNIENQTDLQNALDAKQDSLTEAQLNAVNSGITSEKVTTYDGYADQIASKANQSALNTEATTREQADTALGRRIDDEATARQNADNGLQSQIDAITSQSDVVDVVANYAALQAYDTSSLSDNDVIKVLDDETHEDALTYYRWSTANQTWSYIGQEAPYYSKGQMDVKLAEKQDKLTAGANIQIENGVISGTDTTYTAGNGLNLNGTEFSADTDILATKEDLESYYTKPETDSLLAPKLEAEVVAELPTTGAEGKLYLTPKAHTTQTATGNPITATVAEEAGALESFQLDGDTFQQTYEGKNLYSAQKAQTTTGGITYSIENGVMKVNGTRTAASNLGITFPITYKANTTYTCSVRVVSGSLSFDSKWGSQITFGDVGGNKYVTIYDAYAADSKMATTSFTPTEDTTTNLSFWFGYEAGWTNKTFDNIVVEIQVEANSTATSFEPFVGGQPSPNPDYPQPIQTVTGMQTVEIVGKNLIDPDGLELGDIDTSGNDSASQQVVRSGYIRVAAGNYTLKVNNSDNNINLWRYAIYDNSKTFVSANTPQAKSAAITIANNGYIRVSFYNVPWKDLTVQEIIDSQVQLELGSTASSYTPFSKQALPLDLGSIELCKLGTYQDYIWKDGEDWKVHKATATITLDGTEAWAYAANYNYARCPSYTFVDKPLGGTGLGLQVSNYFGVITDWGTFRDPTSRNGFFSLLDEGYKISIRNTDCSSVEDYVSWLSTNKPSFYYPVATPTDTTITDTTLIAQLEAIRTASLENGANTITNTATGSNLAGDMEIGYYGYNPRNRYDKWLWLDINNEYEQIGS